MWVLPEIKDPVLQRAPTRKSVASFGAANLATGTFVRMFCAVFNAETFQDFLRRLLRHRSNRRRMIIVLDNARYHHARLLAPFLRKCRRVLSLPFLPPYSPQLASIERVWKLTRRLAAHNRYFATFAELLEGVNICFDAWRRPYSVLGRLCCII
jgi:transposase